MNLNPSMEMASENISKICGVKTTVEKQIERIQQINKEISNFLSESVL